ncbi:Transcriptional regulator GlxA family, contains an amidase domain and an AraC-type DNA-binding HTH domain [Ruegeria halocynthiae]|uniref:Transcriptional regulator GlxA family, contains an amidase domain and an AraC-type DNA-binding HTH domain n=1 Tax=Ruegeria halocynthiae TaxID=985054 RepID=A0A1H3EL69_9RHOB|nr:helix-turn-helix domain-containing protein [Ruegeria halocynthiae]SDX79441.1 Transcriptional regulator GlxA family, contains an amidase domain and an AraC-type DNA-binding HTH domain [Ruegeria halocynthiae]
MKHYVPANDHAHLAETTLGRQKREHQIEIILCEPDARASAHMLVEFYRALNDLAEDHVYVTNIRTMAQGTAGGPLHWSGRTAIFWGDIYKSCQLTAHDKAWIAQVLNLSSRSVLVGGAVFLLTHTARVANPVASVHPNFSAAAHEVGLIDSGTGIYLSPDSRTHSASSRLAALRLMSDFIALDHGEHLADSVRSYIGLMDKKPACESQLAARLIRRSKADPMVRQVVEKMQSNLEDPIRIPELSTALGTSTRQLQRRFLDRTGVKLLTTYRELRLERAHSLLQFTEMPFLEVSTATGFSSPGALTRAFRDHYKTTPETIRNRRFAGNISGGIA